MPNRIIKESICTSATIDQLTSEEEVCFYRLMVKCDDFGRFDGRVEVIAGACYPLKVGRGTAKVSDVEKWLRKLNAVNLIMLYTFEDVRYLQMVTWPKHQPARAMKSKYPSPADENICKQMHADESTDLQMNADESACKQISPYSYSYSYSRTISSSKIFAEESDAYRLSSLLRSLVLRNNPRAKVPDDKGIIRWCAEMDRAIRLDKRTASELEQVINWCQDDEFWQTNILSPKKLREQFDKLWLRMNRKPKWEPPTPRIINEL